MHFFESETAKLGCDECRRLTWQTRTQLTGHGKICLVLISPITLGLSLVFLAWRASYEDKRWKCSLCEADEQETEKETYSLSRDHAETFDPATLDEDHGETRRPQKQRFTNGDLNSIPEYGTFRPSSSTGSPIQDNSLPAFKNKPPSGCSMREYWAWHDTLYLGGSWRSPEWQQRAREAKERDGRRCVICKSGDGLQTDHIVPLSQGGSNDFENLQTLCHACHEDKTGRPLRRFD